MLVLLCFQSNLSLTAVWWFHFHPSIGHTIDCCNGLFFYHTIFCHSLLFVLQIHYCLTRVLLIYYAFQFVLHSSRALVWLQQASLSTAVCLFFVSVSFVPTHRIVRTPSNYSFSALAIQQMKHKTLIWIKSSGTETQNRAFFTATIYIQQWKTTSYPRTSTTPQYFNGHKHNNFYSEFAPNCIFCITIDVTVSFPIVIVFFSIFLSILISFTKLYLFFRLLWNITNKESTKSQMY